ncbi:MAG: GDP-L-fucose synthase [Bacteroidota bacterium]
MHKSAKIFIAGHSGMVGSAFMRKLYSLGFEKIITRNSSELDLTCQTEVEKFFEEEKPDYVILAAAKVGGIRANNEYRADFIYENLMIQSNVIHQAYKNKVKKLLFLGSSCIYPKNAQQPLKEEYLLSGKLEPTNEAYALAKIAGIKLCENYFRQYNCDFISVMPTNMFGPNDNYNFQKSHVLPALMRKTHLAKALENKKWDLIRKDLKQILTENELILELEKQGIRHDAESQVEIKLWGTGEVFREFLHVNDFVEMSLLLFEKVEAKHLYDELKQTHINVGTGKDLSIKALAQLIKEIIGFKGKFTWSSDEMNGTTKKCMDISLMKSLISFEPMTLEEGLRLNYSNYINE